MVVAGLAVALEQRGHECIHLVSDAGGPGGEARPAGQIVRVPAWNFPEERLGVPWPLFGPSLVSAVRREVARADVVHAHGALYMSAVGALAAARRAPKRPARVLTEHVGH